jgi:hypothetical protein
MVSIHGTDLLAAITELRLGMDDFCLVMSADSELVLAVSEALEQTEPHKVPLFHLRLMYGDEGRHATDATLVSAVGKLMRVPCAPSRIRLSTETEGFSAFATKLAGVKVKVFPHPSLLLGGEIPSPRANLARLVIIVPGQGRIDKGFNRLKSVLQIFADEFSHLRHRVTFRMQIPMTISGLHIERFAFPLSPQDYQRFWREAHAALLLHDRTLYSMRGSGVACDAIAANRPFICLAGTSLVDWTADGNGIVVEDTVKNIAAGIAKLLSSYETLLPRAALASQRLRSVFSGNIVERLLQ